MKVLLIILLCIIVYIIMAIFTAVIDAKIYGYVEVGNPHFYSNVCTGLCWPLTIPIFIGMGIYKVIDNIAKTAARKNNSDCPNRRC